MQDWSFGRIGTKLDMVSRYDLSFEKFINLYRTHMGTQKKRTQFVSLKNTVRNISHQSSGVGLDQ